MRPLASAAGMPACFAGGLGSKLILSQVHLGGDRRKETVEKLARRRCQAYLPSLSAGWIRSGCDNRCDPSETRRGSDIAQV